MKANVVDVKAIDVESRRGTNERGPWEMHEQWAWIDTGLEFPLRFKISLPRERAGTPYPVGRYELDMGKMLIVGKYGSLEFGRETYLIPVSASASASTRAA